jgi:hypothetical protein
MEVSSPEDAAKSGYVQFGLPCTPCPEATSGLQRMTTAKRPPRRREQRWIKHETA